MIEDDPEGVGRRVGDARKLAGQTQAKPARRTLVSVSRLRAVEQGRVPASPVRLGCARALSVAVSFIICRSPEMGPVALVSGTR